MQAILNLPTSVRLLAIFLLGLLVARFINWAIYSLAYFPRRLGPWSSPVAATLPPKSSSKRSSKTNKRRKSPELGGRSWFDHLPIVGWFLLRRESATHGKWYWVRPLMIELLFPIGLAWYYRFYVSGGTLPPGASRFIAPMVTQMHWQFLGHWVLFTLLAIATFIDFDEQTIPDFITIPGTVIGIVGAAFAPLWLPLTLRLDSVGVNGLTELDATWPDQWPVWWRGWQGLAVALGILAVWGFALLDRRVILRHGVSKAVQYFLAGMFRNSAAWVPALVVTLALMLLAVASWWVSLDRWEMVFSSLLGLAFAGGVTWAVRLSASYGFGAEALGFGDVTLMAMIGSYLGWQPSLIVFFLAPILALMFVLVRWMITGQTATPYGPYLCSAVAVLLIFWDALWTNWAAPIFALDAQPILLGLVICIALIGGMLWLWQKIKQAIFSVR